MWRSPRPSVFEATRDAHWSVLACVPTVGVLVSYAFGGASWDPSKFAGKLSGLAAKCSGAGTRGPTSSHGSSNIRCPYRTRDRDGARFARPSFCP
jgi:hypothetical protein